MHIQKRFLFQPSGYFFKTFCKTLIIAPFIMTISSCNNSTNKNQSDAGKRYSKLYEGNFWLRFKFFKTA